MYDDTMDRMSQPLSRHRPRTGWIFSASAKTTHQILGPRFVRRDGGHLVHKMEFNSRSCTDSSKYRIDRRNYEAQSITVRRMKPE